jgi:hypothetical protein
MSASSLPSSLIPARARTRKDDLMLLCARIGYNPPS